MKVMNYGQSEVIRTIIMGVRALCQLEPSSSSPCHKETRGGGERMFFANSFEHRGRNHRLASLGVM